MDAFPDGPAQWGAIGFTIAGLSVIVGVLWRRLLAKDKEMEAERAKAATAQAEAYRDMRALMIAHADKLEELGREHAGQFQATAEKLHVLVGSLRDALDATSKRVIR